MKIFLNDLKSQGHSDFVPNFSKLIVPGTPENFLSSILSGQCQLVEANTFTYAVKRQEEKYVLVAITTFLRHCSFSDSPTPSYTAPFTQLACTCKACNRYWHVCKSCVFAKNFCCYQYQTNNRPWKAPPFPIKLR